MKSPPPREAALPRWHENRAHVRFPPDGADAKRLRTAAHPSGATLNNRADELIALYLDDELSPDELAELNLLRASNSYAEKRYEAAVAFKKSLLTGDAANPAGKPDGEHAPRARTPLWVRVGAVFMLLIVVGSLAMLPFLHIEQPLVKVTRGDLHSDVGELLHYVEKETSLVVERGQEVEMTLRGGATLFVTGPASFKASIRGPAARIELIDGTFTVARLKGTRECFLLAGGAEFEPDEDNCRMVITVPASRPNFLASVSVSVGKCALRSDTIHTVSGPSEGTGAADTPFILKHGTIADLAANTMVVRDPKAKPPAPPRSEADKAADKSKWAGKQLP
jgi:hypothetical protein